MSSVIARSTARVDSRQGLVAAVALTAAFMAMLDLYIVNVAIPELSRAFPSGSLVALSWTLTAYAIVFAAALIPAGRLADRVGRRRALMGGIALFVVASVGCALAPTIGALVGARCVQAVGAAVLVPSSLGLLLETFPKHQHAVAVGVWGAVGGLAATGGPTFGGLLVQVSWRWIFLVNLPIGLLVLGAGLLYLPRTASVSRQSLPDMVGVVALLVAVALPVLDIVEGSAWGWFGARWDAVMLVALLALGVLLRRSRSHPVPALDLELFRVPEFARANLSLAAFYAGFTGMVLCSVLVLSGLWGYSTLRTGLAFAPGPFSATICSLASGWISNNFGRRLPAVAGPLIFACGCTWWLFAVGSSPAYLTAFLPGLVLTGAGAGLVQSPLFGSVSFLPPGDGATGSAILTMTRQVSSAVGVAVVVAVVHGTGQGQLAQFKRAWVLILVAAALASAVSALPGRRSEPGSPSVGDDYSASRTSEVGRTVANSPLRLASALSCMSSALHRRPSGPTRSKVAVASDTT